MTHPTFVRLHGDSVTVALKVQPRADRNAIAGTAGDELKVKIKAPPVDSAANEALLEFLAELLGCARRDVHLVRGASSRHKVVEVAGLSLERVVERLTPGQET